MTAKLIKVDNGWVLMVDNIMYATDNDKLSLKNCQAIERGYDLDELAEDFWKKEFMKPGIIDKNSYKAGFQKALELMGDKKFSKGDMSKAWSEGYHRRVDEINGNELRYFDKFIQSLQQTEWDVKVEMEKVPVKMPGIMVFTKAPKLDADECLILKRI